MSTPNSKELYDALVGQIAKEDDLYFKRLALFATITGAMISAIFLTEVDKIEITIISIGGLIVTYFINAQINEGRMQLQKLRIYYHENIKKFNLFPCPFYSRGKDVDISMPSTSRIVKGIYFTWISLGVIGVVRYLGNV